MIGMAMPELILDCVLAGLVLALATGALFSRSLASSVCLFIAFGLILALVWVRLAAVDLALAEAAIGAGLTGVLLFNALRQGELEDTAVPIPWYGWCAGSLLAAVLAGLLLAAFIPVWSGDAASPPLPAMVDNHLADSGVSHPVTAVLLNFRAWDTLLELAVVLVAFLGVRPLYPAVAPAHLVPWSLVLDWSRTLAPLLLLAGIYLLWRGSHAPGGAFQAGTLLAAGAIVLRLSQALPPLRWSHRITRVCITGGVAVFLAVAAAGMLAGEGWLSYPPSLSKPIIIAVEAIATVSIALGLTLLVVGEQEELQA